MRNSLFSHPPGSRFHSRAGGSLCALATATALACLSPREASAQCAVSDNEFRVVDLTRNLNEPMEIDIDAGDRVYIAERRSGAVKIYSPETGKIATAVTLPDLYKASVNHSVGLIGLALHPGFENNHWLFVHYATDADPDAGRMRVARLTVDGDRIDMATEKVIFEYPLNYRCCHQAGSIEFGGNGDLFISVGNTYTGKDFEQSLEVAPNPKSYAAKILRIHPEDDGTYSIPEGNLHSNPDEGLPEIYVSGLRNPFRIAVDRETNWVYWGEVGPDGPRQEEFNQARGAGFFGYPYFFGMNQNTTVTGDQKPDAPTFNGKSLPPAVPAIISYAQGEGKLLLSGANQIYELEIEGSCPFSGPIYHYSDNSPSKTRLPKAWDKRWFTMDMSAKWINAVTLNSAGYVDKFERILSDFRASNPMDIAISPRGDMYIMDYGSTWRSHNPNSGVYRVEYTGDCNPVVDEAEWLSARTTSLRRKSLVARGGSPVVLPVGARGLLLPQDATGVELYDLQGRLVWSLRGKAPPSGWVNLPADLASSGLLHAKFILPKDD